MVATVLCFGDSNTHGTVPMESLEDRRRFHKPDRWSEILSKALGDSVDVISEGHPGRTTVHDDPIEGSHKNARHTLLALLESHRPVDAVVMMLGTNDLKSRFNVTANEIAQGVESLVGIVQTSGCGPNGNTPKLLLVAPPILRDAGCLMEFFVGGVEKSTMFPAAFDALAKRTDLPVFHASTVCEMSEIDGIHLDAEGHKALGQALAPHVKALLNS